MANAAIGAWLDEDVKNTADGRYWHRLLVERGAGRAAALAEVKLLVDAAHEDCRRYLRSAFGDNLDPLEDPTTTDVAASYPGVLSLQTLYGNFGELLAGVAAETFGAFGLGPWAVPAYLFRFHVVAFQELERVRLGEPAKVALPGRTGDDCLAFIRNDEGIITATLVCEAKCTAGHDAGMIADAHVKISEELRTPVDLIQLIQILEDRGDPQAFAWVQALRVLLLEGPPAANYESMNLVIYVSGRKPRAKPSWISRGAPHASYTGRRRLEAVEVHLGDVKQLVMQVYGKS